MKKNFSLSCICTLFLLLPSALYAQVNPVKKVGVMLGANVIYAIPQGRFADQFKFGVGGELYAGVGWGSTFITGTVGVTRYAKKPSISSGITAIPVKIGVKKYFLLKRIFLNGDIGSSSVNFNGTTSSAFTAGFGAGVKLLGTEVALYYNTFKNTYPGSPRGYANNLQAKVGWNFTL